MNHDSTTPDGGTDDQTSLPPALRLGVLVVFWTAYIGIPVVTGWSFADRIECSRCWGDVLRHAFALFGYGIIGCAVYALSGGEPDENTGTDRSDPQIRSGGRIGCVRFHRLARGRPECEKHRVGNACPLTRSFPY